MTKAKVGRPVEAVPVEMADEIIEWISAGKTLREFCRQPGKPSWSAVYAWQGKDAEFATRFARARDIGSDAIAEEALEIVDTVAEEVNTMHGSQRDGGHVRWLQNRAEMRLKLLAKWNPKRYGDKLDLKHTGIPDSAPATIIIKTA